MDREIYRSVPFRFVVSKANTDVCKLEQLTNLFPDVKELIELELFKYNNLMQMINRLSNIYNATSAIDTRDDTLHIFLGPYHISLGPAVFGAMRFKNVSKALLASSQAKTLNGNSTHSQKRRHDAALRRFRRAVRKLIHIKSIIEKLRIASILTPYNQYQLYQGGIYDLVLAGYKHISDSVFTDDEFHEQIKALRSTNDIDHQNPLVASQYIKLNTLLQLLSSTTHQSENNSSPGQVPSAGSDDTKPLGTNEHNSQTLIDSANICCSHHCQNARHMMFPIQPSVSQQTSPFYALESRSRRDSRIEFRRSSSIIQQPVMTDSLPDLNSNENFSRKNSSSSQQSKIIVPARSDIATRQEDALVDRISALLTNYLLTHPNDSQNSLLPNSPIETPNFDNLLQRIRTEVDQNVFQQSIKSPINLPIQRLIPSDQQPSIEALRTKSVIKKRRMHLQLQSQSVDSTNSEFSSSVPESNDHTIEF